MSIFQTTKFPTCDMPLTGIETLLRFIYIELGKQNAIDGMLIVNASSGLFDDENFYGFIPREDTVVTTLTIDGETVLTDYNIDGITLLATDPVIMAPNDLPFDSIEVESGSIWVLLKL